MKKTIVMIIALLCTFPFVGWGAGAWAQISVNSESSLRNAITNGVENIQLTANIQLENYLNINGKTVTIDLNGHSLSRNLSEYASNGHIFWVHANDNNIGGNLTIEDSSTEKSGTIEGGKATNGGGINVWPGCTLTVTGGTFKNNSASDNGGAIFVRENATANISNASFTGNSAGDHGGAIWNRGTVTATNCSFENNSANDVGALYNAVLTENNVTYAGTATLTGCTFTGNSSTTGAGALANALGNTEMTISGCTITGNTAGSNGGGIWNGGTLKMQGTVTVTDNHRNDGVVSNVYLKDETVITLTGALTENSSIGVELENNTGTFTSGYKDFHYYTAPNTFFTADLSAALSMTLDSNHEVYLTIINGNDEYYVERSWDTTHEKVASTYKFLKGIIGYDVAPEAEGVYKLVTNAPASDPNAWFQIGGYSDEVAEFYVVYGNVNRETIVVQGKDVHLVLADNATLTLTGGLKLEGDNKLYIHCQSYGDKMGRLMVTNEYENAAGIGSAVDEEGNENTVGELVIHGGHIEATGGQYAAGIGSCKRTKDESLELCKSITVYGGYVKATGGKEGAGIGVGRYNEYFYSAGGDFYLYDGTVLAVGGESASGVGGGGRCPGINVTVYGGSLTALGDEDGAGIGSGSNYHSETQKRKLSGGKCTIFGGTVTAIGGKRAAGIGGGKLCGGAEVNISGGRVMASGGLDGAGIGGGLYGFGGVVTISGGTVSATGGEGASGIGGGYKGQGGDVNITGGTVIAQTTDGAYGPGSAIGEGSNSIYGMGELYIGDAMMVGAGNDGAVERIYDADERVDACWYRYYAEISPCTHTGATYTVNGTDDKGTHTMHCSHCNTNFDAETHNFDEAGECSVCHFKGTTYTVTIYLPDANDDDTYETDGRYKTYTYNIVAGTSFTLPGAPQDLQDMEFAGWLVTTDAVPTFLTYKATADENLQPEKADYTLTGNVNFIARYKDIAISLADGGDNSETLYTYNGRKNASVTLTGRTLYKDGKWNTLCLPFNIDNIATSPLANYSGLMTLDVTSTEDDGVTKKTRLDGTTLNLWFANATSIEAGKPYIIKWDGNGTNNLTETDLVFSNVTISNALIEVESNDGYVTFLGSYSPMTFTAADKSILFLGSNDKLYYPQPSTNSTLTIGAQRAYFQLNKGLTCGDSANPGQGGGNNTVRAFNLSFGGEETGILSTTNFTNSTNSDAWYSLDGRKLNGKPTARGIYINNGKKVVIK